MAKYWKSSTKRAELHKKLYHKFVSLGLNYDQAYKIATKITNWE